MEFCRELWNGLQHNENYFESGKLNLQLVVQQFADVEFIELYFVLCDSCEPIYKGAHLAVLGGNLGGILGQLWTDIWGRFMNIS